MSPKQIEIADTLLRFLNKEGGAANTDQIGFLFKSDGGEEWYHIALTRDMLIDEGIISWWGDANYFVKLTEEGWKASKSGIVEWRESIDKSPAHNTFIDSNINYGNNFGKQTISSVKYGGQEKNEKVESKRHRIIVILAIVTIIVSIVIAIAQCNSFKF